MDETLIGLHWKTINHLNNRKSETISIAVNVAGNLSGYSEQLNHWVFVQYRKYFV